MLTRVLRKDKRRGEGQKRVLGFFLSFDLAHLLFTL